MNRISKFTIKKLHGYKTVDLQLIDNKLILVGENGAGKTTILNLFYYLLSGQWSAMAKYSFDEIIVSVGDQQHRIRYSEIQKSFQDLDPSLLRRLPVSIRHRILSLTGTKRGNLMMPELEMLCNEYGIPLEYVLREMDMENLHSGRKSTESLRTTLKSIMESFDAQILFLPTYRRIEQDLNLIFRGLDDRELKQRRELLTSRRDNKTFVELVEFGMNDVQDAIDSTVSKLNTYARESLNNLTFGYLGDIVEEQYSKVDLNAIKDASDQTIENVLDRIQEHVLSNSNKTHLRDVIRGVKNNATQKDHAKVICHYFAKLMEFQKELQKKEAQIASFCRVCNEYMVDKRLIYDLSKFTFTIVPVGKNEEGREIKLSQLSSGEKQIVSLFSHLYLSGGGRYFVLIDEPELSLSVQWQRKFLVDISKADFCSGLFAVTHSPFIYDNELRKYAHGLGEFVL